MGGTNLLDLPGELLDLIASYLRSFSDLARLSRASDRLEPACLLATKRALKRLERRANSRDVNSAVPAAQLILLEAIADDQLCTPQCASTLDIFSAYLHGRPALMTCNAATNDYLRRCRAIAHATHAGNEKMIRFYYTTLFIKMLKAFDTIDHTEDTFLAPDELRMEFLIHGAWLGILWTSKGGRNTFRFPQETIVLFNILSCLATGSKADLTFTVLQGYIVTDRVVAYGFRSTESKQLGPHARNVKPLHIAITITGEPEWLQAIKEGIYEPPAGQFTMIMRIDSKIAESRGCPRIYNFIMEPREPLATSDTDMERYDEPHKPPEKWNTSDGRRRQNSSKRMRRR